MFFKDPFWGAYFWRGLSMEWNLHFKIGWVSLIVGKKFTIFALFHFVFEGNFQVQALGGGGGAYIWRGDLMEGFLRYEFGEIIFGGAYFRNFIFIWVECLIFTNVFTSMHIIFFKKTVN